MVKLCSYNYPTEQEEEYKKFFDLYSFELHDFQKWSIEGIVTGNHVLITAPTGTGKTMPGEFAIKYFHSIGKKTIYTTPIKALSNEKFYAFTQKFSDISIGLITGDIKTNPDADVLIMTTEILLNKLYQIKNKQTIHNSSTSFEMDIEKQLGCVVFDEIHFINDESRGHTWEQSIMLLPAHIQIIGLSATLDNPEKFANWIETRGTGNKICEKETFLAKKQIRTVPLIHYSFITTTNGINKSIKDKAIQEEIKNAINKPFVIQDAKGIFNEVQYQSTTKMLKLFEKHDVHVKRTHVLNKVTEFLVEKEMLPALCYVFSRKQLEKCAEELTTNLLEFDSKIPYTIDRECEQIIRKLANYDEYLKLPEYINIVAKLRKGVGIHHAGLMPVLREMIELLFAKGFIKILFCTETMSVGINLPVKTTIFTDVKKYNGDIIRTLYSHEYTQAAGRAGRLGLDKVGHVIHLNNLFRDVDSISYKQMMNGNPQVLTSKFKISYNLLLNLLEIGDTNLVSFANKSMTTIDLDMQLKDISIRIQTTRTDIDRINDSIKTIRTPIIVIREYNESIKNVKNCVNKKRKEMERRIADIKENYKYIESDIVSYNKISEKETELTQLQSEYDYLNSYFKLCVGKVLTILSDKGFVSEYTKNDFSNTTLTNLGKIASQIREIHCLTFATLYQDKIIETLTSKQLVMLFSCFANIRVTDENKDNIPCSNDIIVNELVQKIECVYLNYKDEETNNHINTGMDYEIHYDLLKYVSEWCDSESAEDCKFILQQLNDEKEIFLGEFVKALLKINNISNEFERIAEMTGNIAFLNKLKEIPMLTLKFVVTNQSLYV